VLSIAWRHEKAAQSWKLNSRLIMEENRMTGWSLKNVDGYRWPVGPYIGLSMP
jgi:hypothetical protein